MFRKGPSTGLVAIHQFQSQEKWSAAKKIPPNLESLLHHYDNLY